MYIYMYIHICISSIGHLVDTLDNQSTFGAKLSAMTQLDVSTPRQSWQVGPVKKDLT